MAVLKIFRGPRNEFELKKIQECSTAGGKVAATKPTAPSEEEYNIYNNTTKVTGGECMKPKADAEIYTEFTEYTTKKKCAREFGKRCWAYVEAEVDDMYVRIFDHDILEHGVLIRSDTPIMKIKIHWL